jgi:flagellar biosynthesis regulator FlaF
MYQFAYSFICEEPTSQDVPTARKLADAVELFDATNGAAMPQHHRHEALSEFRRIWVAVADQVPAGGPDARHDAAEVKTAILEEVERRRFSRAQKMLASRFFSGSGVQ